MINVKDGKFFYRLTTEKDDNYKYKITRFLKIKGVQDNELQKLNDIDFKTAIGTKADIKHVRFDLNIKFTEQEIILLFGGRMDSDEFSDFIAGFFQ